MKDIACFLALKFEHWPFLKFFDVFLKFDLPSARFLNRVYSYCQSATVADWQYEYTQYPIIRNGPIRNSADFLGPINFPDNSLCCVVVVSQGPKHCQKTYIAKLLESYLIHLAWHNCYIHFSERIRKFVIRK